MRQGGLFTVVGGITTLACGLLYVAIQPWMGTYWANIVSVAVTTMASTEALRRSAFHDGADSRFRQRVQDLLATAFYCTYTSATLYVLHWLAPHASATVEAVAVAVSSVLSGIARFLIMRYWVFAVRRRPLATPSRQPRPQDGRPGSPAT